MRYIWRKGLSAWRLLASKWRLNSALFFHYGELRVIVGASSTAMPGWISTEYPCVDITDPASLNRYFKNGSVSSVLAEHVLEHLTADEATRATRNVFNLLRTGGRWRIAVPDGYHPDPDYIDSVKPNGTGAGADDHKVLFNIDTLNRLLVDEGFVVHPLEWFDASGQFQSADWYPQDGIVSRSAKSDPRNSHKPLSFTSLIVDAVKL